jgi:hypothetical protein
VSLALSSQRLTTGRRLLVAALALVVGGCGRYERLSQPVQEDRVSPPSAPTISSSVGELPEGPQGMTPSAGASSNAAAPAVVPSGAPTMCGRALEVADCATSGGYRVSQWRGPANSDVVALGVYETRSDHSGGYHPEGAARVSDDRRSPHTLLLSSYEPTAWTVAVAPGSGLQRIIVAGYHAQRVIAPLGIRIDNFGANRSQGFACTYAIPSNGGGCDPATMHRFATNIGLSPISEFAGCYRATTFKVSDCAAPTSEWKPLAAVFNRETSGCSGARYAKYNAAFQLWVGAELCSTTEYKLYLSQQEAGPFDPITDSGGHGQDHCELLVPGFSLPSDDDVTSGGCRNCSVTPWNMWTVS